jgi:hypothetical protein
MWPLNSWKYDEITYYTQLAQWANAGFDLNRLESLVPDDFIKIGIIRKII